MSGLSQTLKRTVVPSLKVRDPEGPLERNGCSEAADHVRRSPDAPLESNTGWSKAHEKLRTSNHSRTV